MAVKRKKPRKKGKRKYGVKSTILIAVVIAMAATVYYLWSAGQSFERIPPLPPAEGGESTPAPDVTLDALRVYSFNIQIFGDSKMKKPEVVQVLVDIVSQADVAAIQEVRSLSDEPVKAFMAQLDPKYGYVLGPREGRTASKEQYWVIYDTDKLEVKDRAVFDDVEDGFQRNPMAVYFQTKAGFDFILINNHIQPSSAADEIDLLPEVVAYFQDKWNEEDVMVVGDFNADGSYYNEDNLINVFPESDYLIILTNEYDTTVAGNGDDATTYDRFIITNSAREDYTGAFGVVYYDKMYDFAALGIEPKHISDHFPIWAEFWVDRDTD